MSKGNWGRVKQALKRSKETLEDKLHSTKEFYQNKANKINPWVIGTGAYALATDAISYMYDISFLEAAPLPLLGALAGKGVKWVVEKMDETNIHPLAYTGLLAATILAGMEGVEVVKDYLSTGDITFNPFTAENFYGLKNFGTVAGSRIGYKAVKKFAEKISKIRGPELEKLVYDGKELSRRQVIRKAGMFAAAASIYAIFRPLESLIEKVEKAAEPISELDVGLLMSIEGQKSILQHTVNPNDLLNLTLTIGNASKFNTKDLTIKYFMQNKKTGEEFPLGERKDLKIENGTGTIEGIFVYKPAITGNFEENTPFINPFDDKAAEGNEFLMRVEIYDGEKPLAEKWWGETKTDPDKKLDIDFRVPEKIQDLDIEQRINRIDDKSRKVFLYRQHLKADSEIDPATFSVVDYLLPHFYDTKFIKGSKTLKINDRSSNKEFKGYIQKFSEETN